MFQCTFRTGCLENTWFCKMMNELLDKIRTYRIQALNLVALKQTLINKVEKNLEETISLISRFLKKSVQYNCTSKICNPPLVFLYLSLSCIFLSPSVYRSIFKLWFYRYEWRTFSTGSLIIPRKKSCI